MLINVLGAYIYAALKAPRRAALYYLRAMRLLGVTARLKQEEVLAEVASNSFFDFFALFNFDF